MDKGEKMVKKWNSNSKRNGCKEQRHVQERDIWEIFLLNCKWKKNCQQEMMKQWQELHMERFFFNYYLSLWTIGYKIFIFDNMGVGPMFSPSIISFLFQVPIISLSSLFLLWNYFLRKIYRTSWKKRCEF